MKIKIIAVGKLKDKNLQSVIFDYTKQLKDLEIIEVLDEKSKEGMEKEVKGF